MRKNEIASTIELRQSTIKDFLLCPLMFKYRHIEKIAPAFRNPAALHGSTLHKLLELIHTVNFNLDVSKFCKEIFSYFEFSKPDESSIPVFWKTNRETELAAYEKNALEILDGYRKRPENQDAKVLYSETEFRVKIAGYIFTGTLDQVRENSDGTIELIDFKSSKQMPSVAFLHNDWQLNLYLYAIRFGELKVHDQWIKPKLMPTYSSWYFLRGHEIRKRTTMNGKAGEEKGNALIRTQKGMHELKQFRQDLSNLLKSMLKSWHYPNPNACSFCSYSEMCIKRHKDISADLVEEAKKLLKETEAA
jgi:putative RecB family exonuclease